METKKIKMLLVEDDPNFGMVLSSYLEMNDYRVELVNNGALALSTFQKNSFDFCVLDVMLPGKDGFQIAKEIRELDADIPIIFLTAKTMKEDILKGYEVGADDYITKPFDSDLLLHKIKAILKRGKIQAVEKELSRVAIGKYIFDYRKRVLLFEEKEQKLSPKEAELLRLLYLNKNKLLNRDDSLRQIWGDDNYFTTRSMDVYISKLRKFLKFDPDLEIINVHGSGFILNCSE